MRSDLCLFLFVLCSAAAQQFKDNGKVTYHTDHHNYRPNPQFLPRHVPSTSNPLPRAVPYPGDLSSFLGPRERERPSSSNLYKTATRFHISEQRGKPAHRSSTENQDAASSSTPPAAGLGPVPKSTGGLPAFAAPAGVRTRFTDTQAEYTFDGAGFLQGQGPSDNKPLAAIAGESAIQREPQESSNSQPHYPEGLMTIVPPPPRVNEERQHSFEEAMNNHQVNNAQQNQMQSHGMPIPVPIPAGSIVTHHYITNNGIPIGGYAAQIPLNAGHHPHLGTRFNPGIIYRHRRESVANNRRPKSVRIKVFRSAIKSNHTKPENNSSAKLERVDRSDHQMAESEFVHFGSFPFFGGENEPNQQSDSGPYGVYPLDEREESRGGNFRGRSGPSQGIYSAEEQRGYGYGSLGSGNFEIVRGGIFGDNHAAANSVSAIHGGGRGGYGNDDSYGSYEDEDEPILGFQGFNNFGALQNLLASRKRITIASHPHSSASQLIPTTAVLEATD